MNSQKNRILSHLKTGKALTPLDALGLFDCLRLGARIYDLRDDGHIIHRDMIEVEGGKRVAQYVMFGGRS